MKRLATGHYKMKTISKPTMFWLSLTIIDLILTIIYRNTPSNLIYLNSIGDTGFICYLIISDLKSK